MLLDINKLWIQWGKYTGNGTGTSKNWPTAFNTFLQCIAGPRCNNSNGLPMYLCPYSFTTTGFTHKNSSSATTISYVAFGY